MVLSGAFESPTRFSPNLRDWHRLFSSEKLSLRMIGSRLCWETMFSLDMDFQTFCGTLRRESQALQYLRTKCVILNAMELSPLTNPAKRLLSKKSQKTLFQIGQ